MKIIKVGGPDLGGMVTSISRAASRQNMVQLADFSANNHSIKRSAGTAIAAAAIAAGPISIPAELTVGGLPATAGGILSVSNKYGASRRKTFRDHPMSYFYGWKRMAAGGGRR